MMKSVLYGIIISIHAPREGGDGLSWASREPIAISIHAPREGGDLCFCAGVPVIL